MIDQHLENTPLAELCGFTTLLHLQLHGISEIICMNASDYSETTNAALFPHCDVTLDILTESANMCHTSDIVDQ
jgi:hypothetical protein